MVWHEERFYTAGPLPRNGAGQLADGKPWVSMPLSWNKFTIPTRVTFLAFELSKNVRLMLLISWLLALQYTQKFSRYEIFAEQEANGIFTIILLRITGPSWKGSTCYH